MLGNGSWVLLNSAVALLKVVFGSCPGELAGWNHCLASSDQGPGSHTMPNLAPPQPPRVILEHCTPLLSWHRACPRDFRPRTSPSDSKNAVQAQGLRFWGQKLNGASERSHPRTEAHISMAGLFFFSLRFVDLLVSLWLSASSLI